MSEIPGEQSASCNCSEKAGEFRLRRTGDADVTYYPPGSVTSKDTPPEEKGLSMISAAGQIPRHTFFRRAACAASAAATAVGFVVLRRRRSTVGTETFVPLAVDPNLSFDESLMDNVDWTNQPKVSAREFELLRAAELGSMGWSA